MHTVSQAAAWSVVLMHGCASFTGSQQGEMRLRNHQCDGPSLDNSGLGERLAAACAKCSQHLHWSMMLATA